MLLVDVVPDIVEQSVDHLWGRALDATKAYLSDGADLFLFTLVFDEACVVFRPAFVYPLSVEIDAAAQDILWAYWDCLCLIR